MRRMSCALTLDQVRARTKTETRRAATTWANLKAGDRLLLIEKGMGLPKGARQVPVAVVEVVEVTVEPLAAIDEAGCTAEGFPRFTPADFCRFWLGSHGHNADLTDPADVLVRVIRWRYTEEPLP